MTANSNNMTTIEDLTALKLDLRNELTSEARALVHAVDAKMPHTVIAIQDEIITTANQVVQVENTIGIVEESNGQ